MQLVIVGCRNVTKETNITKTELRITKSFWKCGRQKFISQVTYVRFRNQQTAKEHALRAHFRHRKKLQCTLTLQIA